MTPSLLKAPRLPQVAIACGGTGGHLYPALAIMEALRERECDVLLLISKKEVDQQAVRAVTEAEVATLPAVGLEARSWGRFLRRLWESLGVARALFRARPPAAVLSMGGFTGVAPVLAGRRRRVPAFLHEANAVPGRANRWLARLVDEAFVYFPEAGGQLRHRQVAVTGMPVRPVFQPADASACRMALGLDPCQPVLLVMGGSQGAHGLNEAVIRILPALAPVERELQFIHLTGPDDVDAVRSAYAAQQRRAVVRPFLTEMELALGAATVALSRAGASSLAELAAMRVPPILVPYPAAVDNHQFHNAHALARTGAARVLLQHQATPDKLMWQIRALLDTPASREALGVALAAWHDPAAAGRIADAMLARVRARLPRRAAADKVRPAAELAALQTAAVQPHA